ncbi:hypothetical protein [Burkholderia multivorans]|uniref:hypothetical protein n=1 Tax=Burkholderia multivorans TaxID=87883 RepID=UPI0009E0E1EE|nr:hypothetical protein [Burkholderia multivorans]SAJ97027.1 hypothetical protein UA12_05608 [Burkholderia multivorans]
MNTFEHKTSVKVVGSSGQISLGKEFAGRQVLIEEREPGVWLVRTAVVIPENEAWLHALRLDMTCRSTRVGSSQSPARIGP